MEDFGEQRTAEMDLRVKINELAQLSAIPIVSEKTRLQALRLVDKIVDNEIKKETNHDDG